MAWQAHSAMPAVLRWGTLRRTRTAGRSCRGLLAKGFGVAALLAGGVVLGRFSLEGPPDPTRPDASGLQQSQIAALQQAAQANAAQIRALESRLADAQAKSAEQVQALESRLADAQGSTARAQAGALPSRQQQRLPGRGAGELG